MKYLCLSYTNGYSLMVPAEFIAADRVKYYAKLDSERGDGNYDEVYDREYTYALDEDSYELWDWFTGNMIYRDVKDVARLIVPEQLSIQDVMNNNPEEYTIEEEDDSNSWDN